MTPTTSSGKPSEAIWAGVDAVAGSQHGVITVEQAAGAGLAPRALCRLAERGHLERAWRGVYRIPGSPRTWNQRLAIAVLAAQGMASHRSAARLHGLAPEVGARSGWGLGRGGEPPPEVLVGRTSGRSVPPPAVLYRSRVPAESTIVEGLCVTTVERTLVDVCAVTEPDELADMVDAALHRRLTSVSAVRGELARFESGRRRVGTLRELLDDRDSGRAPTESPLESRAERILCARGVPTPVRQHPVRIGVEYYRLDLAWPWAGVCLEVDGGHHALGSRFQSDRRRQNDLVAAGWQVLRCTARQLTAQPDRLAAQVLAALERCGDTAVGRDPAC